MSGIARYRGQLYYARCHQSVETRNDRYYWMYPLTPEELLKELEANELFSEYFGLHCNYDGQGRRRRKPQNWKEWWWEVTRPFKSRDTYNEKCKAINPTYDDRDRYTKRQAIGFFTIWSWREPRVFV